MWIMVGGPYGTGAKSTDERAANLARMNEAALAMWRKGHVPIIGCRAVIQQRRGSVLQRPNVTGRPRFLRTVRRQDFRP